MSQICYDVQQLQVQCNLLNQLLALLSGVVKGCKALKENAVYDTTEGRKQLQIKKHDLFICQVSCLQKMDHLCSNNNCKTNAMCVCGEHWGA